MEYIEKTLTGIITHGTNSITFTDDFITNESIIDVYFSDDDISPTEQKQIDNRLIITIEPQPQDISIAVHITNDDTINYADELESLSDAVSEHATAISDLVADVDTLENKVDGLNASNINYDEHSTLYSAMGDIDSLETESKNLVGAINENFTSVSNGKTLLAVAITDKGVTTSATDTFHTMASNIGEIETGGGGFQWVDQGSGYLTKWARKNFPTPIMTGCICAFEINYHNDSVLYHYYVIWDANTNSKSQLNLGTCKVNIDRNGISLYSTSANVSTAEIRTIELS